MLYKITILPKMKIVLLLYCMFYVSSAAKDYTNYTLIRTIPISDKELHFLSNISKVMKVDYWTSPGSINKPVDMLLGPDETTVFRRLMNEKNYYYTTVIENIQRAFDEQSVKSYTRRKMSSFDFKAYFRLQDIYDWLRDHVNNKPKEVSIISMGTTYEGREILCVKVVLNGCKRRSVVILEGGIHAREWISPATVCYIMNEIINSDETVDPVWREISLLYEWYFVPVLNPDGYEYSHVHDRLWRKNRRGGFGIDLNRNFDAAFASVGVSRDARDETYCGAFPFSEQESLAMKKLVDSVESRLEFYIGFHSYGQYIVIPYAQSRFHTDNYEYVEGILLKMKTEIARSYGTKYTVGTAYDTVGYCTSGVSGCWVKKEHRVPFVATFEMRDTGAYGFSLPGSKIIPNCKELIEGFKVLFAPVGKFEKLTGTVLIKDNQSRNINNAFVIFSGTLLLIIVNYNID